MRDRLALWFILLARRFTTNGEIDDELFVVAEKQRLYIQWWWSDY